MLITVLSVGVLCQRSHALVSLNDGTDHIYVTGTFGISHDSNIFANKGSEGDFVFNSGISAEYTRRAGWIGVNINAALAASHFDRYSNEDFQNPQLSAEFTKQTGRTTGSLSLYAQRQNRADPAVNLRTASWNYGTTLNFHYPVIERYSFSGSLGYSLINYDDQSLYVDLATYTGSLNLFYILDNTHDLFFGYRYRYGDTPLATSDADHALTVGISGRVLPRINGAISAGYQLRRPRGSRENDYAAATATGSLSYTINKKSTLTTQLSKDFSTTATDTSVDATTATLNLRYAVNPRLTASADIGWGRHRFLGPRGLLPGTAIGRADTAFNYDAVLTYRFSERLSVSGGYYFYQNWSNLEFSDFVRHSWNLSVSSRW